MRHVRRRHTGSATPSLPVLAFLSASSGILFDMPPWAWCVAAVYLVASLCAIAAYGLDKRAAVRNERRIRERTLHIIELAGGWPGAFAAQRLFRHKTRDTRFLVMYWLIVAAHAAVWITIAARFAA